MDVTTVDSTPDAAEAAMDVRPADVVSDTGADVRSCTGSLMLCGGACVDSRFDPMNCGACGTACPSGQVCSNGTCGLLCLGGTQMCSGACVNTANDPANCGACGTACAAGEVCSMGMCALSCAGGSTRCGTSCINTANDPANCGSCGNACAAGETCSMGVCGLACAGGSTRCGSSCVNTANDPANCGSCGNACAAGEACSMGMCSLSCAGGSTRCGSSCVNTANDPANCGTCGTTCAAGEVCSMGACALSCAGGSTRCGSSCVNTATDPANCGTCGTACGATQVCAAGACRCRAGDSFCGGACVSVATSALHCGACGVACAAGQVCNGGACVAPAVGNGGIGGSLTGSAMPRVAVVGAASSTDLQTKLQATGAFAAVDFINANSAPPTLATLRNYDAIVFYTYLSVPATLGDTLASYFEAGGGVVIADYETQETGTYALAGRFQTAYMMSVPIASASFLRTAVTLGTILEPGSALLNGVTTFGYSGSSPYHLPTSAFSRTENNPVVVANFSDGSPAIVRGTTAGGRRLCEINGFALSAAGNSSYGWTTASDGALVFRNALLHVIPPPVVRVATQADAGSIAQFASGMPITITYSNASSSAQTLNAVSLTGAMSGDFAVTPSAALPAMIPAGASFTVTVTASPSAVGLRAATLNASFAGSATPATTLITATGT